MITFTRHVEAAGAPETHTVDSWEKDATFHLAALDGRVPGVKLTGTIAIDVANGTGTYEITGVDPTYGTILARLVKGSLKQPDGPLHEAVSFAPEAAPVGPDRLAPAVVSTGNAAPAVTPVVVPSTPKPV